ncbi:MAG: NCS2 family permease [Planctomycetes bacterium]|nr:NCS2 family permease [Planctomycetota bacterium]
MENAERFRLPLLVKRDIDGFFGLMVDNLINLLVMWTIWTKALKMPEHIVTHYVLPGAVLSIAFGNLFYWLQARSLAKRERRSDVTALPYGINTPSLFAFLFLIIAPIYFSQLGENPTPEQKEAAATIAWKIGMLACFISGIVEFLGAFVGNWIRKWTPRAALLSTLAGIAISLISLPFVFRIWQYPLVAFIPLALILFGYFGRVRFPLGLPAGLVAVIVGTALAWALGPGFEHIQSLGYLTNIDPVNVWSPLGSTAVSDLQHSWGQFLAKFSDGLSVDSLTIPDVAAVYGLRDALEYPELGSLLSLIIGMGLINALGTLQNIESAEAAGDKFPVHSTMMVNGLGSIVAACFGSCFPTTVYIGHPGWKALGARSGYSMINALFLMALVTFGLVGLLGNLIPTEAGAPILLWIGVIIAAQAFQVTPKRHAPAIAVGFFPAIAFWGALLIAGVGRVYGQFLDNEKIFASATAENPGFFSKALEGEIFVQGMLDLGGGFLFSSMILVAICVHIIDREFVRVFWWSIAGAVLSFFGFVNSAVFKDSQVLDLIGVGTGKRFTLVYIAIAAMAWWFAVKKSRGTLQIVEGESTEILDKDHE